MSYIKVLLLGFSVLLLGILYIDKLLKKDKNRVNLYFLILISFFYIAGVLASTTKINSSNLFLVTPLSNISPLMFTLCFVCTFCPNRFKKYFYKLFVNFNIVMFLAAFISIVFGLSVKSYYFTFIVFDELVHISFGLFTIYLIRSRQVDFQLRDLYRNMIIIGSVILVAFLLNVALYTRFFGLTVHENYHIYGLQIFGNALISGLVYMTSLIAVMIIGYFLLPLFKYKHKN